MQALRFEIVVDRPIEQVFAYVTNVRNNVEWFRGARNVRMLSLVDHGVGARYEQDMQLFGWRFKAQIHITEHMPPSRMTQLSTISAVPFAATYNFEPIDDGRGTRMVLDTHIVGSSVYRYMGPWFFALLCRAIIKRMHTLRDILEDR